jgi:hypothetical protein
MKAGVEEIFGRRITGVVITKRRTPGDDDCYSRLYLVFEDGYHYEFYCHGREAITATGGVDRGGALQVLEDYRSESTEAQVRLLDKVELRRAEEMAAALPIYQTLRQQPRDLAYLTRQLEGLARGPFDWRAVYRQACQWLSPGCPPPPAAGEFGFGPGPDGHDLSSGTAEPR